MAGISFDRALESQDIIDLLKVTRNLFPDKYKNTVQVITQRHHWPVLNQWFRDDRMDIQSGTMVENVVSFDNDGTARVRAVRPFQRIQPGVSDVTAKMTIPLRSITGDWSIEHHEVLANREPSRLVKLDAMRKAEMQASIANFLEQRGWKCPTDTSDDLNPYGIPYYLPKISTTDAADATKEAGGHNGQTITFDDGATTTTTCIGIDASQEKYKLWRSWCGRWANDDILNKFDDDDINRIVSMHMDLRFEVPSNATDWMQGQYDNYRAYTSKKLLLAFEARARQNNDSLGADLGRFSGQTVIKGTPVQWVEEIDTWVNSDSSPAYTLVLINHDYWKVLILDGDNFRESGPIRNGVEAHDVYTSFTDLTYQFAPFNRQRCGGRLDVEPME
jgi:hypothetical protein